jgi:UDP-3-O-[3-hydroxymyristoyl] N-acetylglucosamine deacetylase
MERGCSRDSWQCATEDSETCVRPTSVTLRGIGLRSGRPASVVLHARAGPFAFWARGADVERGALRIEETDRATVVRAGESTFATVEHLLAACAALGLHEGLRVEVDGGEAPLLEGGARGFLVALLALELAPRPPALVVRRDATLAHGESRYTFRCATSTRVDVTLSFDDPRIYPHAAWNGDADDFAVRIAPARTFAFSHELDALVAKGHASHVDPSSVVVLTPDAVLCSGEPFSADEPARHKLLDLMGDLFLYGGPPMGHLHAFRPGHRATHAILRDAFARGVVSE